MENLHYIPTWEWESSEGMRERHRLQQEWLYHDTTLFQIQSTLLSVDQILQSKPLKNDAK